MDKAMTASTVFWCPARCWTCGTRAQAAAASRGRHGPVPVPRRIGLEVLLAVPPAAVLTKPCLLSTTMGELAGGVWPGTDYRPGTHGPALVRALHDVHNGKVAWGDSERGGLRMLVAVSALWMSPRRAPRHLDQSMGKPDKTMKSAKPGESGCRVCPRSHRSPYPSRRLPSWTPRHPLLSMRSA